MAANKQHLDPQDAKDLEEAWAMRLQFPEGSPQRAKVENAVRKVHAALMQEYDPPQEENANLKAIGAGALDVLNYGAGLVQTPAMEAAAALSGPRGREMVAKHAKQDWKDTLNPLDATPAPSIGEWMDRMNVPKGSHVLPDVVREQMAEPGTPGLWPPEREGMLDPTVRDLAEIPASMALSPAGIGAARDLGKRALGTSEAQLMAKRTAPQAAGALRAEAMQKARQGVLGRLREKLPALLDPMGEGSKRAGGAVYDSVFEAADNASRKAQQGAVSDVLKRNNVWGSSGQIRDRASALADDLGNEVSGTIQEVHQKAPLLQVSRYDIRQPVTQKLFDLEGTPGMTKAAQSANAKLGQEFDAAYGPKKTVMTLPETDAVKKTYQARARAMGKYKSQPPATSRALRAADNAVETDVLGDAYRDTAQRARRQVEDVLDDLDPGLGGQTYLKNRDIATLLNGEGALEEAATTPLAQKARQGALGTLTGGGLGGLAAWATGNPWLVPAGAALGMGASSDLAKTGLGLGLYKYGKPAGNAARAALMETQGEKARKRSPWRLLEQEMD